MRILGIDYGDARTGIAITDALNITAQGLETIHNNRSDKIILKRLDEILQQYEVDTIVVGKPINMNGTSSERTEVTEKFIHKLSLINSIFIIFVFSGINFFKLLFSGPAIKYSINCFSGLFNNFLESICLISVPKSFASSS